jgi:hypothetical protein
MPVLGDRTVGSPLLRESKLRPATELMPYFRSFSKLRGIQSQRIQDGRNATLAPDQYLGDDHLSNTTFRTAV